MTSRPRRGQQPPALLAQLGLVGGRSGIRSSSRTGSARGPRRRRRRRSRRGAPARARRATRTTVLYSSAQRAASAALRGPAAATHDQRRMRLLHRLGQVRSPSFPLPGGPPRAAPSSRGHALARRREGEAVARVLALVPAGAQAELDPAARDVVGGHRELTGQGGWRNVAGETSVPRRSRVVTPPRAGGWPRRRARRAGGHRERHVVVGAEQRLESVLLAGARRARASRPGDVLLALDHQAEVHGCRFRRPPFVLARPSRKEAHEVHAADPPGHHPATPHDPRRGTSCRARSRARSTPRTGSSTRPRASPRARAAAPDTATTVRVQDGQTLTTDGPFAEIKEALGGYYLFEADDLDAAIELAAQDPGGAHGRRDRDPPDSWSGSDPRPGLPRAVGPRPRCPDRLPRRLRPRRGGRAGGVRDRRGALAARRHPAEPRRLAHDDRAQPRHRPHPPRPHARREDPPARGRRGRGGRRWTRRRSRTSGSS